MLILSLFCVLFVAVLFVAANEITCTDTLSIIKDGVTITGSVTKVETLAGSGKFSTVQVIGTSTELLVFPADLIAEGISRVWLKNLDSTNFVEVGLNTPLSQIIAKLLPGQAMQIPVNKAPTVDPTIYGKADTAAVSLEIVSCGT